MFAVLVAKKSDPDENLLIKILSFSIDNTQLKF